MISIHLYGWEISPEDEEETGSSRNMFPEKDSKISMDGVNNQRGRKMSRKRILNTEDEKERSEIPWTHNKERRHGELNAQIESKRDRGRQRAV